MQVVAVAAAAVVAVMASMARRGVPVQTARQIFALRVSGTEDAMITGPKYSPATASDLASARSAFSHLRSCRRGVELASMDGRLWSQARRGSSARDNGVQTGSGIVAY